MLIFLLLVAVPVIEIALFIEVGGWLGTWPTIAIVILTAAIGTILLRTQGLATLSELQRRLAAGEDPSATLAHGAMILVAGVLLLTPGFFTDAVGFLLLTPPVRAAAIHFARARMVRAATKAHAGGGAGADMNMRMGGGIHRQPTSAEAGPGTVDGEYQVIEPDEGAPDDDSAGDPVRGDSGWTQVPGVKPNP